MPQVGTASQSFFQSHRGYNYKRCPFQNPHAFPKSMRAFCLFQGMASHLGLPFPKQHAKAFSKATGATIIKDAASKIHMPFPKHVCLLPFPRHGQPLGFAFSKASCCNLATSSQPKPFPRPHELRQQVFSKTHNIAPNHVCLLLFPKHARLLL